MERGRGNAGKISVVAQKGSNPHWEGKDSDGDLSQKWWASTHIQKQPTGEIITQTGNYISIFNKDIKS